MWWFSKCERTNKRMNWMNKFSIVWWRWSYMIGNIIIFYIQTKCYSFFVLLILVWMLKKKNSIMILSTETGREKRKRFYGMTRWSRWYCSRNNRRNEWKESIWILSLSLYVFPLEFYSKISLFKSCMWII